ncbi:hypothetical protein [Burkholderia gladioli]|uniref:hypothetical protein n=1 Tax=Burkholderia gladioli TaxID=28095 RepID=UPI00136498FB|nr:hypothetical protein [Burkholderia gladioli]
MKTTHVVAIATAAMLSGCASWSTSSVDRNEQQASPSVATTNPSEIKITVDDVTDRKYATLGDITATVNKTTIFNADPTKEMVNEKLRTEAAKLGADAVILVRYGDGGISLMSWGSLQGKGRAIKFQ